MKSDGIHDGLKTICKLRTNLSEIKEECFSRLNPKDAYIKIYVNTRYRCCSDNL